MKQLPVTPHLYALLSSTFPDVFAEQRFVRLLHHLIFPQSVDEESGWPRIPRRLLAILEEREHHYTGHRYSAAPYLTAFKEAVGGGMTIRSYDRKRRKARTASLDLDDHLAAAVEDELCRPQTERFVDLLTGERVNKAALKDARVRRGRERLVFPQYEASPAAADARWLNEVPPQVFSDVERNLPSAVAVARTISTKTRRMANLGTLFRMAQLGVIPVYKTTRKTPRVYTDGSSAAGLSGNVRKALFGGGRATFHGDLAAAQLAILARIWNLPMTTQILSNEEKIWPVILSSADLPKTEEARGYVKEFVYSTAFGKDEAHLKGFATTNFGRANGQRLIDSDIIQELLAGRRVRAQQMREEDGFTDPFGVHRVLSDAAKHKENGVAVGEEQALKMLMAYEAQSYEFALMQPFLDLARQTKEFRIMFWLHDGVYFRITQPERATQYNKKLDEAILTKAASLGIQTRLEVEKI